MNMKVVLASAGIMLATVFCGTTPTPVPSPTPIPKDINGPVPVHGDQGAEIPVQCEHEKGNVNLPAGSFTGEESITIQCLSPEEQEQLDQAVEDATGLTGEVLGAIRLDPHGLGFDTNVILIIPLLRQVAEQIVDVYIYDESADRLYDQVLQAAVHCEGWCAEASVDHFTTFIAYRVTGRADHEPPEIADSLRQPDLDWVCLEDTPRVTISSKVTDASELASVDVEYWFNDGAPQTVSMQSSGSTFTTDIDLQEGTLNYRILANDVHQNSTTADGAVLTTFRCNGLEPHKELLGLDFPNTGTSVGANNLPACQQACQANDQCMAFTFFPRDGSCWLKSGVPELSNNPDLISGVVREDQSPPKIGRVESSLSSSPVCVQNVSQISISSTIQDESGVSRANLSYTYAPFGGGANSESISMQPNGDVYMATLDSSIPGKLSYHIEAWDIHENQSQSQETQITIWDCDGLLFSTDLFGSDIPGSIYADNPQACRQSCSGRSDCAAFTYNPADGTCWMKYGEPNPTKDPRFISGVVRPDKQGPRINGVSNTPQYVSCSGQYLVQASVSDPSGVGKVELWYIFKFGSSEIMSPMGFNRKNGFYEAVIPGDGTVTYFVRAYDIHGNMTNSSEYSTNIYCIT